MKEITLGWLLTVFMIAAFSFVSGCVCPHVDRNTGGRRHYDYKDSGAERRQPADETGKDGRDLYLYKERAVAQKNIGPADDQRRRVSYTEKKPYQNSAPGRRYQGRSDGGLAEAAETSPVLPALDITDNQEEKGPPESLDTGPSESVTDKGFLEGRTTRPMRPVYFDFDKSEINTDQYERLKENAGYLKNHPALQVRVEGNCDQRGTNEYNMALGFRRAESAKKMLIELGINPGRIHVLSYGEERPLSTGNSEGSRSQNRRDDFVVCP